MKKSLLILVCLLLAVGLFACTPKDPVKRVHQGSYRTYNEMRDGTWECDGIGYAYRLEITGRMYNAANDTTFVYLSNREEITFEQAWKASGLSSFLQDYFTPEQAVLVDVRLS